MKLTLDRMEVEEVGSSPVRMAQAIHFQMKQRDGPVQVLDIARALDIVEIRTQPLSSFEGALITTAERSFGSILLNGNSSGQRRRFTAAHELHHFLNLWHRPT